MAEALSYLLQKIDYILNKEWDLLSGINDEVYGLRREFETIRAILREGNTKWGSNQVGVWINQVRDSANDIEDVLDMFAFHKAQHDLSREHLREVAKQLIHLKRRHSIGTSVQEIKGKLEAAKQTREKYLAISPSQPSTSWAVNHTYFHPRVASLYLDNTDIVGIEEPRKKMIAWVVEGDPKLEVMFVVGMGGLGKTTLVKKVYENAKLLFDHHAWFSVSHYATTQELLLTMLKRFSDPAEERTLQRLYTTNEIQLTDKLSDLLQNKRYFIVFDDLWSQDMWESVKCALPKKTHSRIIITTRRGDVANHCKRESVSLFNLQPLPPKKARELFYMKAFPLTGECPSGLLDWCANILRSCDGLPLAIVAIGDLLSNTEKTADAWKILHDSLGSELQSTGRLSHIMKILSLSFDDLPYYLKYCLLYFSIFPENYSVHRRKLIRLWISEGLVREVTGKTLEEVGEDYIKDLIHRNVVKVNEVEFDGRARTCQVHCLLHKILHLKSQEENFCTVSTEPEINLIRKIRRLSIHKSCTNISQKNFPCARTFFMFGLENSSLSACLNILSSLRILKVLDLGDAPLNTFPVAITKLLLLRYLCLRNTNIRKLPKSLRNLKDLEFLDLKENFISELPNKILNFSKLRHLLVYHSNIKSYATMDSIQGFKTTARIGRLVALQELSFVKANRDNGMIKALGNLTQLRKLGITEVEEQDGKYLCHSIERMTNLRSLDVTAIRQDEVLDLNAISSPPCLLQSLYLKGRLLKLPAWISSLHDLVRISLKWSKLKSKAINFFQHLPNLIELQLVDAFTGSQLVLLRNNFRNLKILELHSMEELETVIMANGALPCLQKLTIRGCRRLKMVPEWTHKLTHLQEFHVYDMPEEFVNGLQKNGGRYRHLVQHIPLIRAYYPSSSGCRRTRDLS